MSPSPKHWGILGAKNKIGDILRLWVYSLIIDIRII